MMDIYDHDEKPPKPVSHFEYYVEEKSPFSNEKIKAMAFQAIDELEGWCSKFKAGILIDLIMTARPRNIVEIGVWGGKSLIPMAFALKELGEGVIYGIDPWSNQASSEGMVGENEEWWSTTNHEIIYQGLVGKIKKFQLENYIELIRLTSEEAPPIGNIDILHIDGNHSEQASFYDVAKWVPQVKDWGYIIFDDITWGTTNRAVEWLDAHCVRVTEFHESCDWGIWLKSP